MVRFNKLLTTGISHLKFIFFTYIFNLKLINHFIFTVSLFSIREISLTSSFRLDLRFFQKKTRLLFILDIHISLSDSILLSRTTRFFQIFKLLDSKIPIISNKHVSKTIETETEWKFQLIGF